MIKYFPKGARILELGCGQGQDSKYFANLGFEVTATDFSQFALDQIRDERISKQRVNLSNKLPFENNSFDIIYSHLTLHYFDKERTQSLFDEIYDILKPGGIFATFNNTMDDPEVLNSTLIEEGLYMTPVGIQKRFFTTDSLAKFTSKLETILLDDKGQTHKDEIKTLIRFVGIKPV